MNRIFGVLFAGTISLAITMPVLVSAADTFRTIVPQDCNKAGGCPSVCNIAELADNILHDSIYLAVLVAAAIFAYAGGRMVFAGGNQNEISAAKTMIRNIFIGIVLILGAFLVVDTILRTLVGSSLLPWNTIC